MVFSAGLQHLPKVGLEVAGGARTGAVVVETPHAAAGQDPPPYPALRLDLRRRQVPEYLAVRRPCPVPSLAVPGVQGQTEPLALLDHDGVPVSLLGDASRGCPLLRGSVREQQQVRDVLVACRALLRQVVGPPQELQHRPDQLLLGHRLVRVRRAAERFVTLPHAAPERVESLSVRHGRLPLVRGPYPSVRKYSVNRWPGISAPAPLRPVIWSA